MAWHSRQRSLPPTGMVNVTAPAGAAASSSAQAAASTHQDDGYARSLDVATPSAAWQSTHICRG